MPVWLCASVTVWQCDYVYLLCVRWGWTCYWEISPLPPVLTGQWPPSPRARSGITPLHQSDHFFNEGNYFSNWQLCIEGDFLYRIESNIILFRVRFIVYFFPRTIKWMYIILYHGTPNTMYLIVTQYVINKFPRSIHIFSMTRIVSTYLIISRYRAC